MAASRPGFEWRPWVEAANYLLDHKLSAEEAVEDADRSIEMKIISRVKSPRREL